MGHFEIIYITSAETQETFAASFRGMPWLTLPFTHALRREQLRHLFEASTVQDSVVLLHSDGSTITRDARQHMVLAYRCQASIDEKKQVSCVPPPTHNPRPLAHMPHTCTCTCTCTCT